MANKRQGHADATAVIAFLSRDCNCGTESGSKLCATALTPSTGGEGSENLGALQIPGPGVDPTAQPARPHSPEVALRDTDPLRDDQEGLSQRDELCSHTPGGRLGIWLQAARAELGLKLGLKHTACSGARPLALPSTALVTRRIFPHAGSGL